MYTQCPACKTAFRVTAQILQRAAGRVRCGGCSNAFNALEYLSEDMPKDGPAASAAAERPAVLHEAKRRQLLETLDELAGPEEVRIEDTGVEWRVLEENAEEDESPPPETSATGTLRWYLEEPDGESRRRATPDAGRAKDAPRDEVMRYDDNTPLPDDFADEDEPRHEHPLRREEDRMQLETAHFDERQVDLALGEPDDWVDLLDEVAPGDVGSVPDEAISLELEEELAAIHSELSGRHRVAGDKGPAAGTEEVADTGVAADDDEELPVID
ncbi:MAG: MJ0042-type zinc finger domain-containing protein, partial [Woeseiaceae bacterium]